MRDDFHLVRRGLAILEEYAEDGQNRTVNAGHEVIYAGIESDRSKEWLGGPHPRDVSTEHLEELESLHWHWDETYDCWYFFT